MLQLGEDDSMKSLFLLVMAPLMLLNLVGGLIGGVWLAILGDWSTILFGIAYMAVGAIGLSLLLAPAMALAIPMAALAERHVMAATLFGLPALIWTFVVIAASCAWVFSGITSTPEGSLIPYLLWGYATAIAPWSYMASKEADDGHSGVAVFFASLGLIAMMVAVWIDPGDTTVWRLLYWIVPVLAVGMILQLTMVAAVAIEEKRLRRLS